MSEKITDIVKNLISGMHSISQTETIIGEPTQVGSATVIPVHRLRVGFMAGSVDAGGHALKSEGKAGSRAVGGTAQVDPVAVLAMGADGHPRLLAVDGDAEGTWQRLMHDAPELMSKLLHRLVDRLEPAAAPAKDAERPADAAQIEEPAAVKALPEKS